MPPALRDPGSFRPPVYTGAPPVVMPQQGQPPAPNPFTKPAAGSPAPGGPPKLTPHQMYQQWVAAGRHGASGANVLAPPAAPPGSPVPPPAPPPGSAPAPGPAPPGSSPSPSGPGGPGAGSGLSPNGNPFVGSQSAPGGFNPFAPFMSGVGGSGGPGGMPHTYAYNDPFNQALALLPTMDQNAKRQISGAMSSAGLSGNRFGSYAQNVAGQIGGETALQENQIFQKALQDQALAEQGQALTANATGVGAGSAMESAMQQQLMNPFAIGQYEQGRQDQFANLRYQDFNQNKLGWFPYLLQGAISRQAGYPGPVMYNTTGSQPGGLDWASALLPGLVGLAGLGNSGGAGGGILGGLFGNSGGAQPGPGQSAGAPTDPGVGG